jgi:hypothetical protein
MGVGSGEWGVGSGEWGKGEREKGFLGKSSGICWISLKFLDVSRMNS